MCPSAAAATDLPEPTVLSRRRILLFFFTLLVLLTGTTYVVLYQSGATREFVRQLIAQAIREDLVRIGDAEFDIASGTLTGTDLELQHPDSGERVLTIKHFEVGIIGPPAVKFDGVDIHLSLDPDETPDLNDILQQVGVQPFDGTEENGDPTVEITNSTVHLRIAPNRPEVRFTDLTLELLPVELESEPDQLELRGSMISPLGHEIEIQGGGSYRKKEAHVRMVAHDIDIRAEQAAAFQQETADFLADAKVTGTVSKVTIWMEYLAPSEGGGNRFHAGVRADFNGLSAIPPDFPYAITEASGQVSATTTNDGTIQFLVNKTGIDGNMRATGIITECFLDEPVIKVELSAEELLIGPRLTEAVERAPSDLARRIFAAFNPSQGQISADVWVFNDHPGKDLQVKAEFDFDGVSARYNGFEDHSGRRVGFPYPVNDISGRLSLAPGIIVLRDIQAWDANRSPVTLNGQVLFGKDAPHADIDIKGAGIEFSPELRSALAALLPGGDAIYDEYDPRGRSNLTVQLRDNGEGLRYSISLQPLLATATYTGFPYRIEDIAGNVEISSDGIEIELKGTRKGAAVSVNGRFNDANKPASELWLKATSVKVDEDLHKALDYFSPSVAQVWDHAQPEGIIDCELALWKMSGDDEFTYDIELDVRDSTMTLANFPLPMKIGGQVFINGTGSKSRCDINQLSGQIVDAKGAEPATVLVEGTLLTDDSGLTSKVLCFIQNLRLTDEVGDALDKSDIFDWSTWRQLKLDGYADIIASFNREPGIQTVDDELLVTLRDISSGATFLPGRLHDLHGEVTVKDGKIEFESIDGKLDETSLNLRKGLINFQNDETHISTIASADSIRIDESLAHLMTGPVRDAFLARRMTGRARVTEMNVELVLPTARWEDLTISMEGDLEAYNVVLDVGLPGEQRVEQITGNIQIAGHLDPLGGNLTGSLRNVGFEVLNQQIYGITGRFEVTPDQLTLTDTTFTLAGGMVKSSREDGLMVRYEFAETGKMSAFLAYQGVSLNTIIRERGLAHSKLRGTLEGRLDIDEFVGSDFLRLRGRGWVVVTGGRLGQVPLFSAIYSHLKNEKRPQFDRGKAVFEISDQEIRLTEFNARSDLIKLEGNGVLNMDGYMDIKIQVPFLIGAAGNPFILPALVNWVTREWTQFRIYGYTRSPQLAWTWSDPNIRIPLAPIGPILRSRK